MHKFLLSVLLTLLMLTSCIDTNNVLYNVENAKYHTIVYVYYGANAVEYNLYSNDSIYTCSFQGTNFLLEKNNSQEIMSTTAPIRIRKINKIN